MGIKKNILVITPYAENGDLIVRSLSKIVTNSAKVVSTLHAINKYVDGLIEATLSTDLIILDIELGIEKTLDCLSLVRDKFPSVKVIIISRSEPPEEIESVKPWNLLRKPFVEKDLLEIINNTFNQKRINVIDGKFIETENLQLPVWARDKKKLVNIMMDSLKNLDAQEAILISENEIIATAGNIQFEEIQSCSKILNKSMDFSGHGELIKQVKLIDNNYLMHALVITVGLIIALLFDPDTSYELIRGQTKQLAGKITQPALPDRDSGLLNSQRDEMRFGQSNRSSLTSLGQVKIKPTINDLLQQNHLIDQDKSVEEKRQSISRSNENLYSQEKDVYSNKSAGLQNKEVENKRPSVISVGMSLLPFTCLLIPRLGPDLIPDDLLDFLEEKTPLIFLSYGWRLNDIMIKKELMQWITAIPPVIAPSLQIKTIRKETSKLIFKNYPKLSMDGLIKDFWVPGYLVAIGSERISEDEKNEMIAKNQQRYYLDGKNNITSCAKKVLYNNY